jgi:hypothetical protein
MVQENTKKDNALSDRNEKIKRLDGINNAMTAQISQLRGAKRDLEIAERDEGAKRIKKEAEDRVV